MAPSVPVVAIASGGPLARQPIHAAAAAAAVAGARAGRAGAVVVIGGQQHGAT
jgi:hypothetical protein